MTKKKAQAKVRGKKMPVTATSSAKVIKAWPFKSSHGSSKYETILREDGFISCDCPGWIIAKKDKRTGQTLPRRCKHTDSIAVEAAKYLDDYKNGRIRPNQPAPTGRRLVTE